MYVVNGHILLLLIVEGSLDYIHHGLSAFISQDIVIINYNRIPDKRYLQIGCESIVIATTHMNSELVCAFAWWNGLGNTDAVFD